MKEEQARALLLKRARRFAGNRKNATGINGWCRKHGVNRGHTSEFVNGKRLPSTEILSALGLEWGIVRKRKPDPEATPDTLSEPQP